MEFHILVTEMTCHQLSRQEILAQFKLEYFIYRDGVLFMITAGGISL